MPTYPVKLVCNADALNEKGRWLEAIGEMGDHYLVMLRNDASGVTSHVHAVLKNQYRPVNVPVSAEFF